MSSLTSDSVFLVTRFLTSDVVYKKLNKKLTRNKSEEIYLKEFDSIRNVRPEYVIFSHGKHFKSYTHTHTLAKKGYRGTWAKSFMQTKI